MCLLFMFVSVFPVKPNTMAANLKSVINFRFSPLIFKNKDNFVPIRFFLANPNDDLKSLILKGGGYMVENTEDADILLCEKRTDPKINDGYLPFDFIVDCIMKDTFLAVDKYRERALGLRSSSSKDRFGSTDSNADSELGPTESSRVRIRKEDLTGRKKYTHAEDLNIIKYLITKDLYSQTGGNVVWKRMESYKVTPHTYQSMKSRFKLIMSRLHLYNIPDEWIAKLEGTCHKDSTKVSDASDDETGSFSEIDEWKYRESKSERYTKDKLMLKRSTHDKDDIQGAECIDISDDDLYTTDISPIQNLERVNDSLSSESVSSVIFPSTPDQNDSTLFVPDRHASGSSGHHKQHSDSSPSVCTTPARRSPRQKINLNDSSPSVCTTPARRSPRQKINLNDSSPSVCTTSARRSPRQKINLNDSSPPVCTTPARKSHRHKKYIIKSSPSSSSGTISHESTTTRQSEDQTNLCAAGSSARKSPWRKKQQIDWSLDQPMTPCEIQLNYPESTSTLKLSFEQRHSDSDEEQQDSDNLSTQVDFIHEGIIPDSLTTQLEGCNCEAGESERIIERKVKYLTKNLHVEKLEALYLLKAFQGSLKRVLEYLQCKK